MQIDWANFSPWSALLGGGLIGLASVLFAILLGRIAGISGIVGGLVPRPTRGDTAWRVAFIFGLVMAPAVYGLFLTIPKVTLEASTPKLILAGLMVGFGARLGSGCTSGHGICGLSRLSPRSLVAVLSFMAAGVAMVALLRHVF